MYKGYPICLEEEDGTVSVLRLKLEPLERIRLHEEVIPEAFRKICRALCEEQVLQDPIFVDEDSKVILDGMHRAAALLKLKYGECKNLFWNEKREEYIYPQCAGCPGKFRNLEYILCCSVDYVHTKAVELRKWYRGVHFPFEDTLETLGSAYELQELPDQQLDEDSFAVLTDGKRYFSLSGKFESVLDKYLALRDVEQLIRDNGGTITYCADEEAFEMLERKEFSFLMITPTIRRQDVQKFSKRGFPCRGEVFPPKSTRHRLSARPLKINIPLRLLEAGDYHSKQEQLKVFLRRKRKLTVTGRLEQYLEKYKILFGEPGELKEPLETPYLWACEFPLEFYEIKYDVDQFTDAVSSSLIQNGMELAYSALIRETNRLVLIISDVKDDTKTETLMKSLTETHFPDYEIKNLFGSRKDQTPIWMIPMESYTPSRAYFERNERMMRALLRTHKALKSDKNAFKKTVQKMKNLESTSELFRLSSEDLLILFAFHVLKKASRCRVFEYLHEDIDDHNAVFSRIDDLVAQGVVKRERRGTVQELALTEKGRALMDSALAFTEDVSGLLQTLSPGVFSEFLKEIDSNITTVIKPDGRKDEFHIGSIMESLVFTDIGWRKVSDVLDRVAEELEYLDFASSDELTSFVQEYLEEKYPLTNIPFRYDYFINSRNYLFLRDEKVVSLSRKYIEKDLDRLIPHYLKMTARQKSQLSNMIYEGIRLLTIPFLKELYEKERIVVEKSFFSKIEEFVVFQAVPVLKKIRNRNEECVVEILRGTFEETRALAGICGESLHRKDTEFLKYYILAMDSLTEGMSIVLGRVPSYNVFARLGQLAMLSRDSSTEVLFLPAEDPKRLLRHAAHVFRRSKSLLDQWRSFSEFQRQPVRNQITLEWSRHLSDVVALIDKCLTALDRNKDVGFQD
jgi:hypothetical protein